MKRTVFLLAASLLYLLSAADETGRYFMTFYTPEQTGGHFQNWAAIQDDRGVMYIGNGYGILEYDGTTWRLIPNTNQSFAFSFAKDSTGRIYVGCAFELGYLAPDDKGDMQFVSLLDQIPEADRGFNYVWRIFPLKEGIFFQTRERMFLFTPVHGENGKKVTWKVKVWRPENEHVRFIYSDYAGNTLYVLHSQKGLMKMVNEELQPIPGSEKMIPARAEFIIPYPGQAGKYLVCTINEGFFVFDGKSFTPWKTEADTFIKGSLADVRVLPDGNIAVGSQVNGLLIIDWSGKLKLHLSSSNGLLSNVIKKIYTDKQGNLWLAADGCVAMIEYNSNTKYFQMGGLGATDIIRFRGKVYAATVTGIYVLDQMSSEFRFVKEIPKGLYNLFTLAGSHLIVSSTNGIYEILESGGKTLFEDPGNQYGFTTLYQMKSDSTRFLAGALSGLCLLKQNPSTGLMTVERKFQDIMEYIFVLREPEPGVLWAGTFDAGVIRITFENGDLNHPVFDKFGPEQGLPPGTVMVNLVNGKLVFSTNKGFYRYIPEANRFEPDPFYREMKLGINPSEYPSVSDRNGNIWANGGRELAFYRLLPGGTYRMEKGTFSRFFGQMVNNIYPENDSITWLSLSSNIVRINTTSGIVNPQPWKTIIRSVRTSGDSAVYLGGEITPPLKKLPYRNNNLSFTYSGLSYINPQYNEYSIRMEGYDSDWSGWSKDTRYNYTNLPPGHYTFRVKCRNIIGQEGTEATYPFLIRTPWYRTIWAFIGYIFLLTCILYVAVRFRTRKLQEKSRELEKIVEQRTVQIQEQKNNVEQLSKIGKDITSSLSIENIIRTVYQNVNNLMDATIFTIGLHKPDSNSLEFPATIEKGKLLPAFSILLTNEDRLAVCCFNNRQEVVINDYANDFSKYVGQMAAPIAGETPESVLYLPLWSKEKVIGVISAQSFTKNAYTDYHLNMLRNLATYSAIALENADAYRHLALLLDELRAAQDRLVTQSKLAALGELTAGIAHEIQNPLNFVNNFSEISNELMDELREELETGNREEADHLIHDIKQNLEKINFHGKRADSIVKSMLQHSRGTGGVKQLTDINNLCDEFFRLAYHGLRAKDKSFNATMKTDFAESLEKINVVPQDIGRVVLNLISNAFYAVQIEKSRAASQHYEPTVWVSTKKTGNHVEIRVKDNGTGIPQQIIDKIFQPFFTTKSTGEGTGLGLSLAYEIVTKGHNGELTVETKEGEGSEFSVYLPL